MDTSSRTGNGSIIGVPRSSLSYRPVTPSPLAEVIANDRRATLAGVDSNGTFDFDKIIKSSVVLKRKRRTKLWKPVSLVLRPTYVSIYGDEEATQLRHKIHLPDITAIALRRDKVGKQRHVGLFGLFTLTRNFHLEAQSDEAATAWVEAVRSVAHLDGEVLRQQRHPVFTEQQRTLSAGSNPMTAPSTDLHWPTSSDGFESMSSVSGGPTFGRISNPFPADDPRIRAASSISSTGSVPPVSQFISPTPAQEAGLRPLYKLQLPLNDKERVIRNGYLRFRLSNRGVRSWNKYWVVLRCESLALYRNDDEYAARLIIPLSCIIDVVETDSSSKKQAFGMQLITDERTYRSCATDEEDLSVWMGRIKSALAKRREPRS